MGLHLVRGAGTAALFLILGVFSWSPAPARDPDPAPPSHPALSPPGAAGLTEDASVAPEGAKTAVGWAVGVNSGGYGAILCTTDGGKNWTSLPILVAPPIWGISFVK